jgi:hypothetical protein
MESAVNSYAGKKKCTSKCSKISVEETCREKKVLILG